MQQPPENREKCVVSGGCFQKADIGRLSDIISDVTLAYFEHTRRYMAEYGLTEIAVSDIHTHFGAEKRKYILLSVHNEGNIDTEANFVSLFTAINEMAAKYDMPILYSCHPRNKKRLEASGFKLDSRVIQHEPMGFHDYNCLHKCVRCRVRQRHSS